MQNGSREKNDTDECQALFHLDQSNPIVVNVSNAATS
jgi:hypothetical protein